ncbi:MAG: decarboxylase [Gemmatimonadetes bacterium]|nr:decarboxylase [Gemmatimonadota bacterium]MYG16115.1 decarboxylase [Gemmatimonadota bacterium]
MSDTLKVGILYPLYSAEDDYPRLAAALKPAVDVRMVHTDSPNLHRIDETQITGSREFLLAGADELRSHDVDVCMWACTSGSFVFGVEGARRQAQDLADALGVPSSSTSLAFLSACKALGLRKVAVAATYPEELSKAFRSFLEADGLEVVHMGCLGVWTGDESALIERDEVLRFARANDHPDAEAVLIPDTALHTVGFQSELETAVGKTVLTANQVTMWEALRLANRLTQQSGLGQLMEVTA